MMTIPSTVHEDTTVPERSMAIVLVVGAFDEHLLSITTRSLAFWSAPNLFGEALIIVLTDNPEFVEKCRGIARESLPADIPVTVTTFSAPTRWPDGDRATSIRQSASIYAAQHLTLDHYLTLDAGDVLLNQLGKADLLTQDGLPLQRSSAASNYLTNALDKTAALVGEDEETLTSFQSGTPFVLTRTVVERFRTAFHVSTGSTLHEFAGTSRWFVPASACVRLQNKHAQVASHATTERDDVVRVHLKWPREESVLQELLANSLDSEHILFATLDPLRLPRLSAESIDALARFLAAAQGLPNDEHAQEVLQTIVDAAPHFEPHPQMSGGARVGRNGHMYIEAGTNEVADQHRGLTSAPDDLGESWRRLLLTRNALCASQGRKYAFMLAPDNQSIYRTDIGDLSQHGLERPISTILRNTADLPFVVYPIQALTDHAPTHNLTNSSDSHWSGAGAFFGYQEMMKQVPLSPKVVAQSEVSFSERETLGDLGSEFSPPESGTTSDCHLKAPAATRVWQNDVSNRGFMAFWRNSSASLPTALFLMDSYGWRLQPLLAESFSWMFVVHSPFYEWDIVDRLKPDVIVQVMAERFVIRRPDDLSNESAFSIAQEKSPGFRLPTMTELLEASPV